MKLYHLVWIVFALAACSRESDNLDSESPNQEEPRELADIFCPVHQVQVFKRGVPSASICPAWDPTLGLTVDELRQRFPYALWDSNIYHVDESPNARFPRYFLVCDRCTASWNEYVTTIAPMRQNQGLKISVMESGEILINDTLFSVEQIHAIAKEVSRQIPHAHVYLRAEKSTPTELIKSVVKACEKGGLNEIIFSTFVTERQPAPQAVTKEAK